MDLTDLEPLATGRTRSLLARDVAANAEAIGAALRGRRVAVIGAAGSIGSAVVKGLARFRPGAIALLDLAENNLVELVRDLRSSPDVALPSDFRALPIGLGSREVRRFFDETAPFDLVFNLAAIKHVRSEKDVYSLLRMIDTNVVFLHDFLSALPRETRVFSVSSDKATNPANLMGATKTAMEKVLALHAGDRVVSSARFANVAFSDGSLPFGFVRRIEKKQAIAAPSDVRRYFMSHEEAGQLCVLSATLASSGETFFPKLGAGVHEESFTAIAERLLQRLGYEPVPCGSDEEAKARAAELIPARRWPCWFFRSATSGEKEFEEFHGADDVVDVDRFGSIGVIAPPEHGADRDAILRFVEFARSLGSRRDVAKRDLVEAIRDVVPTLRHVETGRSLDEGM